MHRSPIALGLFLALALASCGQQLVASAPSTPAGPGADVAMDSFTVTMQFDPKTGKVYAPDDIKPQGINFSTCYFTIANAHMSSTVPGAVKVNGTGNCPSTKEPYQLEATMVLESCFGSPCSAYKTGSPSRKTVGAAGQKWFNQDLNAFATCIPGHYRGRLKFAAYGIDGVAVAYPFYDAVGNTTFVGC